MTNYNYAVLDVESTGLDTENDQVLEIAVVLDNLATRVAKEDLEDYLQKLPVFHCFVSYDRIHGHPYALSMHNRIFNIIAKNEACFNSVANNLVRTVEQFYKDTEEDIHNIALPEDIYDLLGAFLKDMGLLEKKNKVLLGGKNLGIFDLRIINTLPGFKKPTTYKFHHKTIDPGSMYLQETDDEPPSLDECLQRAGITKVVDHTAVGDCLDVVRCVKLSKTVYG